MKLKGRIMFKFYGMMNNIFRVPLLWMDDYMDRTGHLDFQRTIIYRIVRYLKCEWALGNQLKIWLKYHVVTYS